MTRQQNRIGCERSGLRYVLDERRFNNSDPSSPFEEGLAWSARFEGWWSAIRQEVPGIMPSILNNSMGGPERAGLAMRLLPASRLILAARTNSRRSRRRLIQAFAGVSIHQADLNARLLQGDPTDLQEHVATIGAMVRHASRLGVRRRPKNARPTPLPLSTI